MIVGLIFAVSVSLTMAATVTKPPTDKTVTGMVTALDLSGLTITIEDTQFQLLQNVQFVDDKDKTHQLREILPSMTLTLTLDTAGQVKKIYRVWPPEKP
jgi:hypothetical protein